MRLGPVKALDRILGDLAARSIGAFDTAAELLRPPPPVERVERILVVKFWGLGNWALLRPVVRDVGRRWPAARLTVVTLASNHALVQDLADQVLTVRSSSYVAILGDLLRVVRRLRATPADLALDFEQFARAGALLARLGGARQRVGFGAGDGPRDALYTVRVPFHPDAHASRSFRDLAEAAGVAPGPYEAGDLAPSRAGEAEVDALRLPASFVVLHPGSGDNFPGRRWSSRAFGAVGRKARAEGWGVVVTGGPQERELVEEVARASGRGAVALAGRTSVEGLIALLARARVLVSNDTGPVHLASALALPVIALFGPNTPVLYGPLSAGSRVFYRGLPCSPCLTTESYRSSRCRIPTCMASLATGEVVEALADVLRSAPSRAPLPDPRRCAPPSS